MQVNLRELSITIHVALSPIATSCSQLFSVTCHTWLAYSIVDPTSLLYFWSSLLLYMLVRPLISLIVWSDIFAFFSVWLIGSSYLSCLSKMIPNIIGFELYLNLTLSTSRIVYMYLLLMCVEAGIKKTQGLVTNSFPHINNVIGLCRRSSFR